MHTTLQGEIHVKGFAVVIRVMAEAGELNRRYRRWSSLSIFSV
jgi:hypothetical protein